MKNYEFYGVFLEEKDQMLLRECTDIPEGWTIHCNHCTLIHRTCKDQTIVPFLDLFLGRTVCFHTVAIGRSENVIAYAVDLPSMNKTAHITVAVAPGHKPVESNEITEWDYRNVFDRQFCGQLGVVMRRNNKTE